MKANSTMERAAQGGSRSSAVAPSIVHEVLNSSGRSLDQQTRQFMESRFGHDFRRVGVSSALQARSGKLQVGPADDPHEREADVLADRVMSERSPRLDRQFDFSKVRIHTDARAAESARAVNALAYTVGRDVVFGAGQFRPETGEGRRLIAHELAHVAQQESSLSAGLVQREPTPEKTTVTLSTEGKCIDRDKIAEAIPGAREMANGALNWFLSFEASDRARVAEQLRADFRSDSEDVRDLIKYRVLTIRELLESAQAGNITFVCAPSTDTECGGREGYVLPAERDRIHICEKFFNLSLEGRRWTLVHECAHLAGAMASPEIYHHLFGSIGEGDCAEVTDLPTTQEALGNADNYARFVWCLVRRRGIEVMPGATP